MNNKPKILIVDDRTENLVALEKLLANVNLGVEVVRANSGNEALALTLEHDFVLALIDVQMPGMDGYETVELMRGAEGTKNLPVIFVSAVYSGEYHRIKGIEAGAVDFIEKPIVPPLLLGKVRVFLDLYRSRVLLQKAQKELEDKIRERTAELEQAHKDLKEATISMIQHEKLTALGEMSSSVAHELNQPLNVIKIICQGLLRDIKKNRFEPEMLPKDLQDIVDQTGRMADIVDHMRLYCRRTVGDVRQAMNVNEAVNGVFKLVGHQLHVHNIKLIKDLSSDLPNVHADSIGLEQVLLNLITNARHALEQADREKKFIEVKTYLNTANEVVVSVRDNGGGIPREISSKVFDAFFTTKEPGKGTGLGLSISKKIVEESGGRITLEVEEGVGSTFFVALPGEKGTKAQRQKAQSFKAEEVL